MNHVVADDRNDCAVFFHFDRIDDAVAYFQFEFRFQRIEGAVGFRIADAKRNRIFRRRLRDEQNRNRCAGNGGKDSACHTGSSAHIRSAHAYHRRIFQTRNAANVSDFFFAFKRAASDPRTAGIGTVTVFAPRFDILCRKRRDRFRVKHFTSEKREFERFFVTHIVDEDRVFYDARIGRIDAVDVRPKFHFRRTERCGDNRSGKIGTVSAEQSRNGSAAGASYPRADKARKQ